MLTKLANAIDWYSHKQGEVTSLLALPLLVVVLYEVFMRYAFNAPTVWGFELTTFIYGIHYMFGLSYTDATGGHVKVDIFSARASRKTQAFLNIFSTLVLFLPVMTCLTIWSIKFAHTSVIGRELNSTSWAPMIWPVKIIMAFCFLFLALQGFATLLRYVRSLMGVREPSSSTATE